MQLFLRFFEDDSRHLPCLLRNINYFTCSKVLDQNCMDSNSPLGGVTRADQPEWISSSFKWTPKNNSDKLCPAFVHMEIANDLWKPSILDPNIPVFRLNHLWITKPRYPNKFKALQVLQCQADLLLAPRLLNEASDASSCLLMDLPTQTHPNPNFLPPNGRKRLVCNLGCHLTHPFATS